jgi:hypothetical protein
MGTALHEAEMIDWRAHRGRHVNIAFDLGCSVVGGHGRGVTLAPAAVAEACVVSTMVPVTALAAALSVLAGLTTPPVAGAMVPSHPPPGPPAHRGRVLPVVGYGLLRSHVGCPRSGGVGWRVVPRPRHQDKDIERAMQEAESDDGWTFDPPARHRRKWTAKCGCGEHQRTVALTPSGGYYAKHLLQWLKRECWRK